MGDKKRKAAPRAAAAGAAQKRQSVPASPPGSPRAAAAAPGLEQRITQILEPVCPALMGLFADHASAQTADIKRALSKAQAAAASAETKLLSAETKLLSAETKLLSANAESETKLSNLQQQLQEAVQANAKTALQPLPRLTQYSQSRTEAVPPGGAIFEYLEENFLRTATRHRGPRQGDPHRAAPEFQVRTCLEFSSRCVWG